MTEFQEKYDKEKYEDLQLLERKYNEHMMNLIKNDDEDKVEHAKIVMKDLEERLKELRAYFGIKLVSRKIFYFNAD